MKKIVLITFFLLISLSARENPFTPQNMAPEPKPIPPKIKIEKPQKRSPAVLKQKIIPTTAPVIVKKTIIKSKVKKPKIRKSTPKPKLIYNGVFTKIKLYKNRIEIITKDEKLQHLKLTRPNRLAIDFERFDVVRPFSKKVYGSYIKHLKVGHHDYFYRTTFKLAKNYRYKITKKPYGYLIKLY